MKKDMDLQVLIAAMHQEDFSLLEKMNIQSDAIIGNQCDSYGYAEVDYKGHQAKMISCQERGVGLNRNTILMRSNTEISVLADDDMRYVDGYAKIITKQFKKLADADVLIFHVKNPDSSRAIIKKLHRVRWFNYMRYGAAQISVRTSSILRNGIFFSTCFGGGTKYSSGEDTLFLSNCLKKGLKIYAVPIEIAVLSKDRESTWFKGYHKKYFFDKGVLYCTISKKLVYFLCFQDALRHRKLYGRTVYDSYSCMIKGAKSLIPHRKKKRD